MKLIPALLGAAALSLLAPALKADQATAPVQHVLLISVDGMHAVDFQNYIASHKNSTLAALSGRAVTYPYASTTRPSDSFPGLVAQLTGGTSKSTGIYYDVSYNRALLPPGSALGAKPGTAVAFDESIDNNLTLLNGGGGINLSKLPVDPTTAARCIRTIICASTRSLKSSKRQTPIFAPPGRTSTAPMRSSTVRPAIA